MNAPAPLDAALALPLPLRRLFVPLRPCKKLGEQGVQMVRKWAARADVVLLNQKELAAELEALKQAHLTLRVRGAGPLAHYAGRGGRGGLMRF